MKKGICKNKSRVAILIKDGKMTEAGMDKIKIAKSNFDQLAPSLKKQYIYWIGIAKKEETKKRRSEKAIQLLIRNEKLGIV